MKPLHYTASSLVLGLALMGNAQAVTTIPFWNSMEGEMGKEGKRQRSTVLTLIYW